MLTNRPSGLSSASPTSVVPASPSSSQRPAPNDVSGIIAEIVATRCAEVFALMGNGNVWLIDALEKRARSLGHPGARGVIEVRHEVATVASADAYFRATGEIACATTTFGPGYTNTMTALAESALARIPVLYVVGDAPTTGMRSFDISQADMAASCGVPTVTITADTAVADTHAAIDRALHDSCPVVLAVPHDLARAQVKNPGIHDSRLGRPRQEYRAGLGGGLNQEQIAALLSAEHPLILAGRGARAQRDEICALAAALGADVTSTAPTRGFFGRTPGLLYRDHHAPTGTGEPTPGAYRSLGVCGGFASPIAQEEMRAADVVLVLGAGLNHFTLAFGDSFSPQARIIQVDVREQQTSPVVTDYVRSDLAAVVQQLTAAVHSSPRTRPCRPALSAPLYPAGTRDGLLSDGRLDPRALFTRLNEVLPHDRVIVTDGGHFMGWPNMYLDVDGPEDTIMVGTAFQSIGLGFPSSVGVAAAAKKQNRFTVMITGDGGGMMGIADAESFLRMNERGAIIVVNDSAYGAEIHQYAVRGADEQAMQLPDFDFAALLAPLAARAVVVRTLDDLEDVVAWLDRNEPGTIVVDCRVSREIVARFISEMGNASAHTEEAESPSDAA